MQNFLSNVKAKAKAKATIIINWYSTNNRYHSPVGLPVVQPPW